ncbi:MAG: DMT family transporter [Rhizobiales bacterium]|nr:DMT family transporter [Hyphomicrobiales bacterium]
MSSENSENFDSAKPNLLLGIGLMTLAMLIIPLVDGQAKYLSGSYSPFFISWARYAMACLIVIPISLVRHRASFLPKTQRGAHFLRTIFLMAAMTSYFFAISMIPLATAISAYFIGPVITTLLAVFFLGERLTTRKILALLLGFCGALIILRPTGEIEPGILLAMLSGLLFALYMIATRRAARQSDPIKTLAFQCLVGAIILTPQALWAWSAPLWEHWYLFLGMGIFSALSHLLSIAAFRYVEASTLAPLVYVELVATAIVGYWFFNELPDAVTWIGAAVIVAGGLMLIQRAKS